MRAATEELQKVFLKHFSELSFLISTFRNSNKNWLKIQEHFFFGAFHPVRDYSVEVSLAVSAGQMEPVTLCNNMYVPLPDHLLYLPQLVGAGRR